MARISPPRRQAGLSMVVVIALALAVVLLLGGGTAGVLFATGVLGGSPDTTEAETAEAAEEPPPPPAPPVYLPLEPVIVVNLRGEGATTYLQAGIEVMARGEETISAVQEHMPVVRNNLLLLLGSQTYKDIDDRQGKERLRQQALEEVNKVLAEQGIEEQVEAVYFTSFVLQ